MQKTDPWLVLIPFLLIFVVAPAAYCNGMVVGSIVMLAVGAGILAYGLITGRVRLFH